MLCTVLQDGREKNRGSDRRQPHSIEFKAKVLENYLSEKEANPSIKQAFAAFWGISQGMLSVWLSQRNAIFGHAADSMKRKLCRSDSENVSAAKVKFAEMEKELFIRFKERRNQVRRASARWIKKTARKLLKNWTNQISLLLRPNSLHPMAGFHCS